MLRDFGDEVYDQGILPSVHLGRAGGPEEIADTILLLCSDAASYITGTTLTPDGGLTLTVLGGSLTGIASAHGIAASGFRRSNLSCWTRGDGLDAIAPV